MNRILFVTNGHGEAAIAARIAAEVRALAPLVTEQLPLVGAVAGSAEFATVGPRRAMPSGGLVAMGNVRAFARDLRAGWFALFGEQLGFLRRADAAVVVAVGDAYGCALARLPRRPLIFVGTAKSVYVAPYGPVERRILAGAARVFVRDLPTAVDLRAHGVVADAPGNVIVDLLATNERFAWTAPAGARLALLPGSRERAYADAERLTALVAALAERSPGLEAALSIAPGLDPAGFAPALARSAAVRPWRGAIGAILADATLALGQAGTANEAAAANGVPVVALEFEADPQDGWYRKRQRGLLGEALAVVPGELPAACDAVAAILTDAPRRTAMGRAGRARMGGPGGAAAIARAIVELAAAAA